MTCCAHAICRTPGCGNLYEPYADDGDGEYRTEDFDGMCESCNSLAVNCVVCDDRFVPYDPSDPGCHQCPDCAAEVVPTRCNHTDTTCASCERY
jgi:hypothetical protein